MSKSCTDEEFMQDVITFFKVQNEAEEAGTQDFTCPLCGGNAWWGRSTYNNHLHCGCRKCGFKMME